ncbi:MAG: SurA N-terminal domain-containing protein, partial [Ectothiorhodospiraceae bacterium]
MSMTQHGRAGAVAAPLLALLLVSAPPMLSAQETLDRIAAVVNEDVILESELEQELQQVRQRMQSQNRRPPPEDELVDQVLEQLIMERLQLSRAEEMGIEVDDNTLNAAVRRIAQQNNMNLRQFRRAVQNQGMDFATFREDLRQDIRMRRLKQQAAQSRVNISSRDVEEFLDSRAARMEGTEFRVSHILVDVSNAAEDDAVQQARERAEGIMERLQEDDESFDRVASSVSDAEDALEGGDLGWRRHPRPRRRPSSMR